MENNKLIGMVDFVLLNAIETPTIETEEYDWYYAEQKKLDVVKRYAEFLKQPLTLSMFIPVSEAGEALEDYSKDPDREEYWDRDNDVFNGELYKYNMQLHKQFMNAKDKIIFEGFRIVKFPEHKIETLSNTEFLENDKGERVAYGKDWETDWYFDGETIEALCGLDISLTPNALKLISGS